MTTERQWEDVEPAFKTWEKKGESVEGNFISSEEFVYATGDNGIRYILEDDDGVRVAFNGTKQLNSLLQTIEFGTYIKVEYVGEVKTSQPQPAKIFKVYREAS